ncbi:hypothetical protein [Paracidovorax avenae]|uniref:hypothetical protein n=1 Tax=Paracidovorax avenae TaxID=80867 RepID=UPI001CEF9921|nr:hypothetical protein [Paracidovorax avenae]
MSTFFSKLQTPGTLTALWTDILEKVALRPMLQDGVGVAGMGNYAGLEPLRALLRQRGVPFDLIIELFEQLPPSRARAMPSARALPRPRGCGRRWTSRGRMARSGSSPSRSIPGCSGTPRKPASCGRNGNRAVELTQTRGPSAIRLLSYQ